MAAVSAVFFMSPDEQSGAARISPSYTKVILWSLWMTGARMRTYGMMCAIGALLVSIIEFASKPKMGYIEGRLAISS